LLTLDVLAISQAIKLVPVVAKKTNKMAIKFNTKDVKTRTKRIEH